MNIKKYIYITIVVSIFCVNTVFASKKAIDIERYKERVYLPNIPFFDVSENEVRFNEYEDNFVLVVFWATWCGPCTQEIEKLDILSNDFKKLNLKIIAISEDFKGIEIVKQFYSDNAIKNLEVFYDRKNSIFKELQLKGLPTAFLIDKDGRIILKISGYIDWNKDSNRNIILSYIQKNSETPRNSSKENLLNTYNIKR